MPYRIPRHAAAWSVVLWWLSAGSAVAQTYTAGADLLFYGDNTEFASPFRQGETLLGISGRVFLDVAVNDTVTLRGGVFGLGRFGAHEFLEHAEPALSLQIARGAQRFVFGSLETAQGLLDREGPDRDTLHGLIPPLQRETLTFSRGQEMGLQWIVAAPAIEHDAWVNWQRLNTAQHRERFDAGYRAVLKPARSWWLHGQWHVVHEGGQQFGNGSVRDSQAGAVGLEWRPSRDQTPWRRSVEAHLVGTHDVPDRARPQRSEGGVGLFIRGAAERGPWRAHLIVWRGWDALKQEGDANYLSSRLDGTVFLRVRDYGETGVTRHFRPAPGVHLMAAFRLHRVESHYEYSYRIVGRLRLRQPLSRTP